MMMQTYLVSLALYAMLLTLIACAPTAPPMQSRQEQTVDGLSIALVTTVKPYVNETQELLVILNDAQGVPVNGADVYFDLTMPVMPMGANKPIAAPKGQGVYRAQTAFTMSGDWVATVIVSANGIERQATFHVVVEER